MSNIISIPPSNLLLDEENPRLAQANEGQREVMRALAKRMPRKILSLAKDIVEYGLNPADLSIVMPAGDRENRHIVLEGNRRLVALKALENPDSFVGALDGGALSAMRKLARTYQESPIDLVPCVLMKNRDEADHWIRLRHTGENDGAGIVPWGGDESNRFRARGGKKKDLSTQALDFLQRHGTLSIEDRSNVPATNLTRLLATPEVRTKLGLGLQDGELQIFGKTEKVIKALKHVVSDLSSPDGTNVKGIYHKDQRQKYAEKIPKNVAVTSAAKSGRSMESSNGDVKSKAKTGTRPRSPKQRDYLIPRDCVLIIKQKRLRDIEQELRSLSLENYTNAVSVLLRVFIELSMDEFINLNPSIKVNVHSNLAFKMEKVVAHLIAATKLTDQQAKPVRKAMQKGSYLGPSIDLMHDYIHNQNAFPAPGDLRAHWDSLQPFMTAVWSK